MFFSVISLSLIRQKQSDTRIIHIDEVGKFSHTLSLSLSHDCSKPIQSTDGSSIIAVLAAGICTCTMKKLEEVFKLSQPPSFHSNGCCNCNDSKEKSAGSHLRQALRMLNSTSVRNPRNSVAIYKS